MTNGRNAFSLLGGKGRKQGACTAEQNVFQLSLCHLAQQIAAEHHSAATAAGSAGMNILFLQIKNHGTAVIIYSADADTVFAKQFHEKFLTTRPRSPVTIRS